MVSGGPTKKAETPATYSGKPESPTPEDITKALSDIAFGLYKIGKGKNKQEGINFIVNVDVALTYLKNGIFVNPNVRETYNDTVSYLTELQFENPSVAQIVQNHPPLNDISDIF